MSDKESENLAKTIVLAGTLIVGFIKLFGSDNDSFFACIGNMGAGKSTLINALSNKKNMCASSASGKSVTQDNNVYHFRELLHNFHAIDTGGLDEKSDEENEKKINKLKGLLAQFPKLKKILLVKKYNDNRLAGSTISSLKAFMECFPLKDFWKHVIIVNTHAEKTSAFKVFMKKEYQPMVEKIKEDKELMNYMKEHEINEPEKIQEYFVESFGYLELPDEYSEERKTLDHILNDIKSSYMMYDEVKVGENKEKVVQTKIEGILKKVTYRTISLRDGENKYEVEEIISEHEEGKFKPIRIDYIDELIEEKDIEWYDILTLGIARFIRETKRYKRYMVNTYNINDQEIKGEKLFDKYYWK